MPSMACRGGTGCQTPDTCISGQGSQRKKIKNEREFSMKNIKRFSALAGAVVLAFSLVGLVEACINGGVVTTIAGVGGSMGYVDGTGSTARFGYPMAITKDSSGNLFVADAQQGNYIRKVTPSGIVTTLAGGQSGYVNGTGSSAGFAGMYGIAADSADNLYVTELLNGDIRKITPSGVVTTFKSGLDHPVGIAIDGLNNVYVAAGSVIEKITQAGVVTTIAGQAGTSGYADGIGTSALFSAFGGMTIDASGNLYVTDRNNYVIRKITPAGVVTTVAGTPGVGGVQDGVAASAKFLSITGITVDPLGNIYVTDGSSVRVVTPAGMVATIAGYTYGSGSLIYQDGTGSGAGFDSPQAIVSDSAGVLYVGDTLASTIRRIQ